MNDARQLYLATYGRIDTIDNMVKKCQVYYCCWKYWHSAKNHGLSLAVVVAYGMYKECASETLAHTAFGIPYLNKMETKLFSSSLIISCRIWSSATIDFLDGAFGAHFGCFAGGFTFAAGGISFPCLSFLFLECWLIRSFRPICGNF
jgi:hypothetical protein